MIYCVEDDNGIRKLIVYTLNNSGFTSEGFTNGAEFFNAALKKKPSLVLLDIMLPGEDGISILKKIRKDALLRKIPVIMLTAKDSEYDKVLGFDNGADDYITKPFGMTELISRIKAVLRRCGEEETKEEYNIDKIKFDADAHTVTVGGKAVDLTLKEYNLLHLLIKNAGIVLTREVLLEKIWGYDFEGETRTLDVHIRTLRSKLGNSGDIIKTIRGVGYKVEAL